VAQGDARMAVAKSIPLARLKAFWDWKKAPPGALVQGVLVDDNAPFVGMRCELNSGTEFLLRLDSANRGIFIPSNIVRTPMIDVSHLFEIAVVDPSPSPVTHRLPPGGVFEYLPNSNNYLVATLSPNGAPGLIWLTGDHAGKTLPDVPPFDKLLFIGMVDAKQKLLV
jgi:hypothetical protein